MGKGRSQARAATNAARLQSNAATQVAQIQSSAALEAAQIQQDTALKAASIAAGGAAHAAGLTAGATMHAANLQNQAQERALAEQKRQYDGAVKRFQPYAQMGEQFIDDVSEASTIEGLDARLAKILDSKTFGAMYGGRMDAAQNQMAQVGMSRSGAALEEAASVPTNLAMAIEGQLYGRQMNNVGIGQAAAAHQVASGQNYANNASNIMTTTAANIGNQAIQSAGMQGQFHMQGAQAGANGMMQAGNAAANGILGAASASGAGIMGAANATAGGMVNAANARAAGRQQALNTALTIGGMAISGGLFSGGSAAAGSSAAGSAAATTAQGAIANGGISSMATMFSDERLKENMEKVGKIGELNLYEWDWKPQVKGLVGTEMSLGFKAQEVEEIYPDCVSEVHGIKKVNYPLVHKHLEKDLRLAS